MFNYDILNGAVVNQRLIVTYNTQCCGIAVEYQRFNYGGAGAFDLSA